MKARRNRTLFCLALIVAVLTPAMVQAQPASRANATFVLPDDFGKPSVGKGKGFEECSSAPVGGVYDCSEIEIKQNERVVLLGDLNIRVASSFQMEQNTEFNLECYALNIEAQDNFVLKSNTEFNGNVEATKEIKLESNSLMNGDATSLKPEIIIESNSAINGTCNPSNPRCGGVSQCALPLSLIKSASSNIVAPGDELTYTLDFSNEGDRDALNAVVTDEVPTNTTFVSATGGPDSTPAVGGTGTVTWSGDLSVGETSSVSVTVRVDGGVADGTILTNDALLTAAGAGDEQDQVDVLVQSQPLLTLSNEADVALVDPGGQVTYTLTVENVGNATATNPVLTSQLDPDTIFLNATGGGVETSPGVVEWSAAEIQAGSQTVVSVTVQVLPATPRGEILANIGTVASDQTTPVPDTALVGVDVRPLLSLTKTADQEVVEAGDTLTYTLDFANTGSDVAEDVSITDNLPTNTVFLSATGGGVETSPGTVTWGPAELGDLLPGDDGSVQVTVRADSPLADGTRLINRANLLDVTGARVAYSEVTVPVSSRAELNLVKTGDRVIVEPGDFINYTIVAENTGNAVASNLVLEDAIPENTLFVEASGNGTESAGVVTWAVDELPINRPQEFLLTVKVVSPLPDQTTLFNTASLQGPDQAVTAEFVSTVRSEAILELDKIAVDLQNPFTGLEVVEPGDEIGYVLTFRNTGNATANNILIEDPLPANTTFVDASDGGLLVDGKVVWSLDALAPGTQAQVGFAVEIDSPLDDGTRIYNVATVDADATRAATADVELFIDSSPVLSLEKFVDKNVAQPGDLLTYTLAVRNTGNANALNPVLEDRIPANTSFVSASGPFTVSNGVVTWSVPALNAGADGSVTLTVRVDLPLADGTTIDNSALLNADNAPSVTAEVSTQIESTAILKLTKTADAERLQPGDEFSYRLTIENEGNATANSISLTDRVPQNTSFVRASGGGVESAGVVTWAIGGLQPGPAVSVTMTVRVLDPVDNGTLIVNSALAGSDNSPEVGASIELVVDSASVLELTKVADKTAVAPGEDITYTLNVTAAGNAIARNTQVLDFLPRNTQLIDAPGATVAGRRIVWDLGDLTPGDTRSLVLAVRADTPLDDSTIIRNLALLSADDTNSRAAFTRTDVDSSPDLSLTKTASSDFVAPGDEYSYSFSYGNEGNANAQGVVLEDTVPANTSFVSATGGGVLQGNSVVWDLGTVNASATGEVTATFRVAGPPLPNGTVIDNTATLTANNVLDSATSAATVLVESAPLLSLAKSADKAKVAPDQTITYVLTGRNDGNDTALNAVFEDPIPDNTSFLSATGGGVLSGGVVRWSAGDLLPGVESSVSMTVQVASALDNGTVLKNTASFGADNGNLSTASATTTVVSAVDLEVEKTTNDTQVAPGDTITYTIEYANVGNANASDVDLFDVIPDNTSFVSATGSPTVVGKTTQWDLGALLAGDNGTVTLVVRVDSPLDNQTLITNSAVIREPGGDIDQDSAVSVVESAPRLALDKSASASVIAPGDEITYTLNLGNTGNAVASGLTLVDRIPQYTTLVSASSGAVIDADRVSWSFASLAPGQSASVTMTVEVDSSLGNGTSIDNLALADAVNATGVLASVTSTIESSPVLSLTKTPNREKVDPGSEITYRFAFANTGNDTATSVVLEDTVPAFTTFVSASGGGSESGGIVTWNLGQLPAGESGEVTATFEVDGPPLADGSRISNVATVNAAEATPVSDSALVTVSSAPLLRMMKSADREVVSPGEQITFTVDFSNSGSDTASNVVVTDVLPDNTSLAFASGDYTQAGDTLTWLYDTVAPGVSGSLLVVLDVDTPLENGVTLENVASIRSDETSPAVDTAVVRVQSEPVLEVTKRADTLTLEPGTVVTYTLDYANVGTTASQGTALTDTLPSNTSFVSASAGGVSDGSTVTWNIGQLLAGSQGNVLLTVQVDSGAANGDRVLNTVLLDSQNAPPASASLELTVSASPVLSIDKFADKEFAQAGEPIVYQISYANGGNGAAAGAVVSDTLPANVSLISAPGATVSGSTVSWSLGTLAPGASGTLGLEVSIDVSATAGEELVNRASIAATDAQPVTSPDAVVTVTDGGTGPILGVSIDGAPGQVGPGDEVTYTVGYSNSSTGIADNPRLVGLIPEGTVFVSASNGGVVRSENGYSFVEWSVPSLAGDTSGTVSYVVRTTGEGDVRVVTSSVPPTSITKDLYRPGTKVSAQSNYSSSQSALQTSRPIVAIAAIEAANASPPQVASTVVFLTIPNVQPATVDLWSVWQLLVVSVLLLAMGGLVMRRRRCL